MANTLSDEIMRVLNDTGAQIRANMEREGLNASGHTSASIHTRNEGTQFLLVGGGEGAAPIPTLELGRRAGKVPAGFYGIILDWTREKGLQFPDETERKTFAYFLSRKIAREGSERYRDPSKRKDVYSTAVTDAKAEIANVVRTYARNTIVAALGGMQVRSLRGAFTK